MISLIPGAPAWAAIVSEALNELERHPPRSKFEVVNYSMPYCLERVVGTDSYIALNRNYMPVGLAIRRIYLDRKDFPAWFIPIEAVHALDDTGVLAKGRYFYSTDAESPWRSAANLKAYLPRVQALVAPWVQS